jgi:predicted transcriptional regulator
MEIKTERKRTLTLNLSEAEMAMLAELADHQGMSKSAVLRQALRLYRAKTTASDTGDLKKGVEWW